MVTFRKPVEGIERPQMEADVVIVGAGPAGLACALRLTQLIDAHNAAHPEAPLSKENLYLLEKAREAGEHNLSGALLDPRSLRELLPGFENEELFQTQVTRESVWFLTKCSQYKLPIVPPPLRDHGNYVLSVSKLAKWLAGKVEEAGFTLFTGFAAAELLMSETGVEGVETEDKGVDKNGRPKSNFEPGYRLRSKITILAEGSRGSATKQLIQRFRLEDPNHAMTYGLGVKELWELPAGRIAKGEVIYTMGYPLSTREYGGAWIYGLSDTEASVGYVTSLDYKDPRVDPHHVFQSFKEHPFARRLLTGGRMVRYGARTLPYSGWLTTPKLAGNGWMIVGDSAAFLNSQRLKGIHLAIKSGMLAAETAFEALIANRFDEATLSNYKRRVDESWIRTELYPVRNFHQGFRHGLLRGLLNTAIQQVLGGRNLGPDFTNPPGYTEMKPVAGEANPATCGNAKGDGKLSFDRLTDVYHSGTRHEEDQPTHLTLLDPEICTSRCTREFGNPCRYFCPAAVYEMEEAPEGRRLKINFSNCVHCKTCDILDPYQIINWVPPEGGGGPNYDGM